MRDLEILEAGLILVVSISIASVGRGGCGPHNGDLMREHTVQFRCAALAVGLCIVERGSYSSECGRRRGRQSHSEKGQLVHDLALIVSSVFCPLIPGAPREGAYLALPLRR